MSHEHNCDVAGTRNATWPSAWTFQLPKAVPVVFLSLASVGFSAYWQAYERPSLGDSQVCCWSFGKHALQSCGVGSAT